MALSLASRINQSPLVSRDLSWIDFNARVLDQAAKTTYHLSQRLQFLSISARNADEFFMIRVGSLYNYLDYDKERIDYCGLSAPAFRELLLRRYQAFARKQNRIWTQLLTEMKPHGIQFVSFDHLNKKHQTELMAYYEKALHPMLTPMSCSPEEPLPVLRNLGIVLGIVTKKNPSDTPRISFIQLPQNVERFIVVPKSDELCFVPVESLLMAQLASLFKNVQICSTSLFRLTRNGDFTLEESEDIEDKWLDELKRKLKARHRGRVVRIEVAKGYDTWLLERLVAEYAIDDYNVVPVFGLLDLGALNQVVLHARLRANLPHSPAPRLPVGVQNEDETEDIFELLKKKDLLLHHPYHSFDWVVHLLQQAAEDPMVLSIKLTLYRVASHSRIIEALIQAARNKKHVLVLIEVKARFDEAHNMHEAQRLEQAGCYVIYGGGALKVHTKLLLIVRQEADGVRRYLHTGTGNYNERTARLYTDIGILSARESYADDVAEFFHAVTGHSYPERYKYLISAPHGMQECLLELIQQEVQNAKKHFNGHIIMKMNSLQDKRLIEALYAASQSGVRIQLIVRGVCCLRPQRKHLSETISVRSIVGQYLEHSRIYYFHHNGQPVLYVGSADIMVRSFERRFESLIQILNEPLKDYLVYVLKSNLRDNVNAYEMQENGRFVPVRATNSPAMNVHRFFYEDDYLPIQK